MTPAEQWWLDADGNDTCPCHHPPDSDSTGQQDRIHNSAACDCNPAGPGPDNAWGDGPPYYDEACPVHGRPEVIGASACRFRPSKPPWPSQMCATCGEWSDDHVEVPDVHTD